MLKEVISTLESLGEFNDEELYGSFLGTLNMFHFLHSKAEEFSENIEEYIAKEEEELKSKYGPDMFQSYKMYIDSNLFTTFEKSKVTPQIKENNKEIQDLQKGWPIIEYACDIFQGLPGEIPKKELQRILMKNFMESGWKLVQICFNYAMEKDKNDEEKKNLWLLRRSVSKSCCYCGRIKKVGDSFPAQNEELLFMNISSMT